MKRAAAFALVLLAAACGADGPPEPPEPDAPRTGVSVSGTATIGISGSF